VSFWDRWFGRDGEAKGEQGAQARADARGSGDDVAPPDPAARKIAWLEEKLADCRAPEDISALSPGAVATALRDLFATSAAKNGHGPATLFGMVVGAESAAVLPVLEPEPLLAEWEERLEAAHGAVGRSFYAEVAHAQGIEVEGAELRRGRYHLTFEAPPPRRSGSALVASDTPAVRELEATLAANPDDLDTLLVYADALAELGHPRGELISMEHRIEGGDADPDLLAERERLRFDPLILPEQVLAAVRARRLELTWHLGFVRSLRIHGPDIDVASVLEEALAHPTFGLLRSLTVGLVDYGGDNAYEEVMGIIADAAPLPTLEAIFIGDFEYPEDSEMSWTVIGDAGVLWSALPRLREVTLQGGEIELGSIDLPGVRRFAVRTGGLPAAAMQSIIDASWPRLEELEIWFGDAGYGAEASADDVARLLQAGLPATLKVLRLRNAEFTDELVGMIASSGILERLETLDLSMGTLSNDGCAGILANASTFAKLDRLDVSECFLNDEMIERLQSQLTSTEIVADEQKPDDDDFRYVSVGE